MCGYLCLERTDAKWQLFETTERPRRVPPAEVRLNYTRMPLASNTGRVTQRPARSGRCVVVDLADQLGVDRVELARAIDHKSDESVRRLEQAA